MKQFLQRHGALWLLIGFCLAMGLFLQLRTGLFFAGKNLTNIFEASSFRLLLAIGMTFIIAAGAIDLSVGAILSLSAILAAKCMQNGMAVPRRSCWACWRARPWGRSMAHWSTLPASTRLSSPGDIAALPGAGAGRDPGHAGE